MNSDGVAAVLLEQALKAVPRSTMSVRPKAARIEREKADLRIMIVVCEENMMIRRLVIRARFAPPVLVPYILDLQASVQT